MTPEKITVLISRYLDGAASPEEEQELLNWYRQAEYNPVEIPFTSEEEKEFLRKMMRNRLEAYAEKGNPTIQRNAGRKNTGLRLLAAAIITGVLGIGVYWLVKKASHTMPVQTAAVSGDIRPGGNKAILTTASGKQIDLDTSPDGFITVQDGARVSKTTGGEISYSGITAPAGTYNTLTTPNGGQYKIVLQDGTRAWLNASSSIRYPTSFTGTQREVEITGEVFFEVTHKPNQPFRVKVGTQLVEDLGTSFNINAYPETGSVKTTLVEGEVKINNRKSSIVLQPGTQAMENAAGILKSQAVEVDEVIAWKNGFFAFRNSTIEDVMQQFARWYNVEVVYEGAALTRQFKGKIDRSLNLDQAMDVLGKTKVHYRIDGRKIIILP